MSDNPFRQLPSVAKLLDHQHLQALRIATPHMVFVDAIRLELETLRQTLSPASTIQESQLLASIERRIHEMTVPRYRTVINATGIVLHTNLGRSPMAEVAAHAAFDAARSYISLEMDLDSGERSSRQNPIREGLCRISGAESATAVNNCAAATVITLRTLAAGKEVIVSRGQLVEIGGSFRIPEILATSGAILREVGTTNITRLKDYEAAINPNTAALMRVHCSNYRLRGFTETVSIQDLTALGMKHSIPVIDDVGSGAAINMTTLGFEGEPTIREGLEAGADLVLFSGDKLLGGPQAGIIAGKKNWIEAIECDPLMRAFRLDKMSLAALAATLVLYCDNPLKTIPTLRMLSIPLDELRARTLSFAEMLKSTSLKVEVRDDVAYAGGGSLADQSMPTVVIAMTCSSYSEEQFAVRLRKNTPAVLARIQDGKLLLDLRTVFPEQEPALFDAISFSSTGQT